MDFEIPAGMAVIREHLAAESRMTLVHGDFRNGNLMIVPEGVNAVMDRELANRLQDDLSLDTPGLVEHLRQTVAGRLAIDQPHYCALLQ